MKIRSKQFIIACIAIFITTSGCTSAGTDATSTDTTTASYTVTFSGDQMEFSLTSPQEVEEGETLDLTLTTDTGYTLSSTVGGTCPAGSFAGSIYTTGAITSDCTLSFSATADDTTDDTTLDSTTLSVSISTLALSVDDVGTNAALTGTPRVITITNSGTVTASNLDITYPTFPTGTTATTNCDASLTASSSCTITITPGANATSSCDSGITPTPGNISISAENASTVSSNVSVLTYGCIYQGGYIFSVDDTTSNTSGIGGKVAAQADQAAAFPAGIIWSSNGAGTYDGGSSIYGIDETSTTATPSPNGGSLAGQSSCNGATDGSCNTTNIIVVYSLPNTDPAISFTNYAAGLCKATISGYSDWYLPSVCEMGYDRTTVGTGCGSAGSPTLQNIQSNLVDNGDIGSLSGVFWSSSQLSSLPGTTAWFSTFATAGGNTQSSGSKGNAAGVRCVRSISN